MPSYPWVPIYRELGERLLDYRDRQDELLTLLREARDLGHKVVSLEDRDAGGASIPLTTVDPFTFFASFNRTNSSDDRSAVLALIKERLDLEAPVPQTFFGIPALILH